MTKLSIFLFVTIVFVLGIIAGGYAVYPSSVSSSASVQAGSNFKKELSVEQRLQDAETATFAGRVSGLYDIEFLTTPDEERPR